MESPNSLCRLFKTTDRFVANAAGKRRQNTGETPARDRESLNEFFAIGAAPIRARQ
jgi:hypothetical protein